MDLEQYKQTWKNQPEENLKLSQVDIYKLTHKKSSSVVKWILIIGIIEFCLTAIFSFLYKPDYQLIKHKDYLPQAFFVTTEILSFGIIIYFLIQFYKNYKSISVSEDTKTLLEKIRRTRKSVKNYVLINLSLSGILLTIFSISVLFSKHFKGMDTSGYIISVFIIILCITIILIIFWLIYQLIYGILLKKLNKNYKELSNLEESNL